MTLAQAQATLAAYPVTISYEYSDTVAAGIVISQNVANGAIALVVSQGPNPTPPPTPPQPDPPTPPTIIEFMRSLILQNG